MNDIDFDELDKAVNSLMGSVSAKDDQPQPKTLRITSTLREDEKPAYEKLKQVASKIGNETILSPLENTAIIPDSSDGGRPKETTLELASSRPLSVPSLPLAPPPPRQAPKPSGLAGRFMDVMHPSSDMKTSAPDKPAAPSSPSPASPPPSLVSHFGEPSLPASLPPVVAPQPAPPQASPVMLDPLTSPFIPDAKVEKRPLGGAQDSKGEQDTQAVLASDTQLAPKADAAQDQLPEELHGDLLAIETNFAYEEPPQGGQNDGPNTPNAPSNSSDYGDEELSYAPGTGLLNTQPQAEVPLSSLQANNQPNNTTPSVFETENYYKTVTHPARATPSWLWILAIIAIIVICALGGAAFYMLSS